MDVKKVFFPNFFFPQKYEIEIVRNELKKIFVLEKKNNFEMISEIFKESSQNTFNMEMNKKLKCQLFFIIMRQTTSLPTKQLFNKLPRRLQKKIITSLRVCVANGLLKRSFDVLQVQLIANV
jgi:hypothetical protein